MKLVAHTNAGSRAAAVVARPVSGRVRNDYRWLCAVKQSGIAMSAAHVITEPKFHLRWPRDLSP